MRTRQAETALLASAVMIPNTNPTILVTGATGTIGRQVVHALQVRGARVIAAAREPEKAGRLFGEAVETRALDFAHPQTFASATAGVDRVFLLGPPLDPEVDQLLTPFLDHLAASGLRRVVYFSGFGMEGLTVNMGFHARLEARLRKGFAWTMLRPGMFASNFANYFTAYLESGVLAIPCGTGKTAYIDPRDIGACAAEVLTGGNQHIGQVYTLTGPQLLDYHQVAAILSAQLDKPIRYEPITPEALAEGMAAAGMPPAICDYMNAIYALIREGHVTAVHPDVAHLLGRPAMPLDEALRDLHLPSAA